MGDFIVPDTSVENEDSAVESEELEDNPAQDNPTYEYNEDPVKPTE